MTYRVVVEQSVNGEPMHTVTASISASVPRTLQVAQKLADEKIGAVPVVDEDGRPLGIISNVDVLRALAA